ncbi:MAG: hypothetical protein EXR72_00975 [Myxococcales bacterium]|nr:hypothetical protein [Myxococcales bacterium]
MLYECLAGHPPFGGDSIGEVLRMHLSARPAGLRTLDPEVPRALDEVVQRLLRKDPRDRCQTARAALFDLEAIASAVAGGDRDPAIAVGAHDWRRTLTEPAFVGRQGELVALAAQLARARLGRSGLALVEAQSGGGKTRLLGEFALQALRAGALVLRGQGVDHAARRPFQLLVGVAADLARAATGEPGLAAHLRVQLGESANAAAAALPELRALPAPTPGEPVGPETFAEARTIRALCALLDALGTPERPALVLLDDGQWADGLTLKLLAEWSRRGADRRHSVLVVVAFRSEEAPANHLLRKLNPSLALELPPLPQEDLRQLAASMAGPLPGEIHDLVAGLAEGSPFMVSAVLRGLSESGALVAEVQGWRVEPLALEDVRSSRHAAAFLARRIELLPPDALAILEVGAVLGKEFDVALAASLAEQSSPRAIAAIDEARRRHILWMRDLGARCAFVHDRLREALLARISPERLRALHLAAAQRLEVSSRDRVFELAYHFDAAGDATRALPYALAAAADARARHALTVAEDQYRIAARGAAASEAAVRRTIHEGLGDVLMLRGRYEAAAGAFEAARELCAGAVARAEVEVTSDAITARLCVRDHGIGIAPEDQARIFERFERAVSLRSYGGLGLGLWITREIVAAMGGQIRVESRPGEGSAFHLELPRAQPLT